MEEQIRKWLTAHIPEHELQPSTDGGEIIFVPIRFESAATKYLRKLGYRHEYRANYSWIAYLK